MAHLTDQEIASQASIQPIQDIAKKAGIPEEALEMYGKYKAKVDINQLEGNKEDSKIVLVSAMNPTPAGDRKSTRLNSSHVSISYAVFCLKKTTKTFAIRSHSC